MIRAFENRATQKIAGFQSPAEDYLEGRLDILQQLIVDPENTHYAVMASNEMESHDIKQGDILIIDKSVRLAPGAIGIFSKGDTFYTRRYEEKNGKPLLCSDDSDMTAMDMVMFGVVIASCRGHLPPVLKTGKYARICTC